MDKGAHFYKCDLQVHTPRDINWQGHRAVSEADRVAYSIEFVKACRDKGIGAVAITDHHDMEFLKYVLKAAQDELDDEGNAIRDEDKLVVFPGMELTLQQPCQALLIFDASFTPDLFPIVYNCLGIVPSASTDATTIDIQQLPFDLIELHQKLDAHPSLIGKYIVLPHVKPGGHQTLMRKGFHQHYANMPCVGGYLDGSYQGVEDSTKRILAGKVSAYAFKSLGVFQTSDNRQRDFAKLGQDATWIKWSEPTAEALRQACLAKESRLSHAAPSLPNVTISAITISSSRFLGNVLLELNPQYNAIIGGRGTGKSTILEYLRWALCDEPQLPNDEDAADFQAKRLKLIDRTLTETGGSVDVRVIKNGVLHLVRRTAQDKRLLLKIGDGPLEPATEDQVRTILPIQAYSQKQLSSVGVRVDQLLKFIETPIREALDGIDQQMQMLAGQLREQFARYVRVTQLNDDLRGMRRELTSIQAQVEATRKGLTGISDEDRALIGMRELVDEEEQLLQLLERTLEDCSTQVQGVESALDKLSSGLPEDLDKLPNAALVGGLAGVIKDGIAAAIERIKEASKILTDVRDENGSYNNMSLEWTEKHNSFLAQYEQATQRTTAHQSVLKQLQELEQKQRQQVTLVATTTTSISELGGPEEAFDALMASWVDSQKKKADLLGEQCNALTDLSGGRILASLLRHQDFEPASNALQAVMRGSSIRREKFEVLFKTCTDADQPLAHWMQVLDELKQLTLIREVSEDTGELPATPLLSSAFSSSELLKIATKMGPDEWLALTLIPIGSSPHFQYKATEGEYIPFEEASAGQQATALLWALLNEDGPPLVIDQPEDDLDSQIIVEIIGQVWKAKANRQLIFTSHNANLVVNGDAELVVCCDYLVTGEQSKGQIAVQGAIDMQSVRKAITQVMEGGEEAFKLRHRKYNF